MHNVDGQFRVWPQVAASPQQMMGYHQSIIIVRSIVSPRSRLVAVLQLVEMF